MSNLHLPDYTPVHPATKTVKPRQRIAKLPDWGIEQRATQGQNQTSPEWNVQWILEPIEANTLDFFLSEQAKTGAWFLWTPPDATQARFRCDDWTKQLSSCNIWEVQATFRQVFSFALPRLGASTGYFVLSGRPAALLRGQFTRPNRGIFTLAGNPAALSKGYPILANAGTFALAGGDIGRLRTWRLAADTGVLSVTMSPVTFVYFSLSGEYFDNMASQIWGWDRDFQVDWWGD